MGGPETAVAAPELMTALTGMAGSGASQAGLGDAIVGATQTDLPGFQKLAGLAPDGGGGFLDALQKQAYNNPMMAMMLGKSLIGNPGMKSGTPPPAMPQPRPMGSSAPWGGGNTAPPPISAATIGGGDNGGMSALMKMILQLQGR